MSKKPEIAIFELISTGTSGFIRKGTERDSVPDEIKFPRRRRIANKSVVYEYSEEVKAEIPVKTRFISGVPLIKMDDQNKHGYTPNDRDDAIEFVNGNITVVRNGSTVGLYDFLMSHARNGTNDKRPKDAKFKPIFKQLKPDEKAKASFNSDFDVAEALMYVKGLTSRNGNEYVFSEDRIDLLCTELGIFAEEYSEKIAALTVFAKANPVGFLDLAKKSEQTVLVEIDHALKLKVIEFADNTAMYVKIPEKIKAFPGKGLSDEKKATALGAWFKTVDGKEAYDKFRVELQSAKDDEVAKQ